MPEEGGGNKEKPDEGRDLSLFLYVESASTLSKCIEVMGNVTSLKVFLLSILNQLKF